MKRSMISIIIVATIFTICLSGMTQVILRKSPSAEPQAPGLSEIKAIVAEHDLTRHQVSQALHPLKENVPPIPIVFLSQLLTVTICVGSFMLVRAVLDGWIDRKEEG